MQVVGVLDPPRIGPQVPVVHLLCLACNYDTYKYST